jgi:hypothetical protein
MSRRYIYSPSSAFMAVVGLLYVLPVSVCTTRYYAVHTPCTHDSSQKENIHATFSFS